MEELFVKEKKNNWFILPIFAILMIATCGLVWFILYDEFHERRYMINRRRLIKAINNGEVTLVSKLTPDPEYFNDIEMFDVIDQNGDTYDLWLWTRRDGVVKATIGDHIGLFTGSLLANMLNNKLVRIVRAKTNAQ